MDEMEVRFIPKDELDQYPLANIINPILMLIHENKGIKN